MEDQTRRIAEVRRQTRETEIRVRLDVDGFGEHRISTGIPFFDHLLTGFAVHGCFDLEVDARGDLAVDFHHTVEDTGIVLGQAFREALGDKAALRRYGFFLLPMDDVLVQVALDLGGRAFFDYRVEVAQPLVRDFNIGLVREFLRAWSHAAGANLHVRLLAGDDAHHVAEATFKGFGRALDAAVAFDERRLGRVPSTKGVL